MTSPCTTSTRSLREGRPGQKRRAGHVVTDEQRRARDAGVRHRDGDSEHESPVDGEVHHDVEEAAEVGCTTTPRERPVETVSETIREPQDERGPPDAQAGHDTRGRAEHKTDERHRDRRHARPSETTGHEVERTSELGAQRAVEHDQPRTRAGIPVGLLPVIITMTVLFGGALVGIVVESLRPGRISGGSIGFSAWGAVLHDPALWRSVLFTLWIAVAATALAAVLGLVAAVLLRRAGFGRVMLGAPVAVPHLVVAALAVVWLAPGGIVERILGTNPFPLVGDAHGFGIIAVYVYKEAPFLALLALAAWDGPTEALEEAAATLGATRWRRLRDIVLPRVGPPLAGGSLIVAAFVIGATEVPLVVGPTRSDTIATYALSLTRTDGPAARPAASAALVVAAVISLLLGAGCVAVWRKATR